MNPLGRVRGLAFLPCRESAGTKRSLRYQIEAHKPTREIVSKIMAPTCRDET